MEIDQQRNILYALKLEQAKGMPQIDVYDLGVLGDEFTKVTSITLTDLNKHVCTFFQSS